MLFNSLEFAVFLPIIFMIYWVISPKRREKQNVLLLVASYVFYGWWDWRFLSLIIFSTIVDFVIALKMQETINGSIRKILIATSLIVNLGLLGFFKYYNFFLENFVEAFTFLGYQVSNNSLSIVLPVGISFYTFQTLSYTIDVYRNKIKPTDNLVEFAAFVSFFPQLVAGPIERASHLLPQFGSYRYFEYHKAVDGIRQILWGLFKKVVIADNCAVFANQIFNNSGEFNGSTLAFGALFFSFQIYGDFSGYSDIAIGVSRLFGFDLKRNFAFPYFSRDIAEFWRRWHISLSSWFRDYLYIPLGGSRGGRRKVIRNTFVIFIVSGFWHGANWTYIFWGALNALYFLPLLLVKSNRRNIEIVTKNNNLPSLKEIGSMLVTFGLVVLAWVFFRAENLGHAFNYLGGIFSPSLFSWPFFSGMGKAFTTLILIAIFLVIEWNGRNEQYALEKIGLKWKKYVRYTMYCAVAISILWFEGEEQEFIYFQF